MQENQRRLNNRTATVLAWLAIIAITWLLLSGLYKPIVLTLGALSCVLTVYVVHRTGFFDDSTSLHVLPRMPGYWFRLCIDIVKSSLAVTRVILDPKLPISPTVVEFDAAPKGPVGQVILGNSITLSPGTVTVDMYEGRLSVHCLTQEGAEALLADDINRRTAELTDK